MIEITTLDQMWRHANENDLASADAELRDCLASGWQVLNITVAVDAFNDDEGRETWIHRIITLQQLTLS